MKILIFIFAITLLISGCATTYQKKTTWTIGHSETQLAENIFRVSYEGTEFTGNDRVIDYTLLRSAEVTIENGYKYFAIISEKSSVTTQTFSSPSTYHTYGNAISGYTTYAYGGGTYTNSYPSTTNTIMLFKEKPQQGIAYDAVFVATKIREKYKIK